MTSSLRAGCTAGFLLAALPALASAQTVTLLQKEVLRVHFHIASPPSPTPDVLSLGLGLVTVNQAHTTRTGRLYDCDNLLGTAATSSFGGHTGLLSLGVANSWKQAGSVYNFDNPGIVNDFSSLQNATIEGIIDFEIATGSITLDLGNVTLRLIRATHASGGSVSSPQPTIDEVVVVPKLGGPTPGTVGVVNTWTVSGGQPGNTTWFVFGTICGPFTVFCIPPSLFDIANPLVLAPATVDPRCNAFLQINVPSTASGVSVLTQCIEVVGTACKVSNFVRHTFP